MALNVSHGGAHASRDVRLGGAFAPSVGSLGGAAGRFTFERATSDLHPSVLYGTLSCFSVAADQGRELLHSILC